MPAPTRLTGGSAKNSIGVVAKPAGHGSDVCYKIPLQILPRSHSQAIENYDKYRVGGEGGIRTLGPPQGGQRFSRPPRSTAPAPLHPNGGRDLPRGAREHQANENGNWHPIGTRPIAAGIWHPLSWPPRLPGPPPR